MICTRCDQPIDGEPHFEHEPYCVEGDVCTCDLPVHADCCTSCRRPEIEGQLSLEEALDVA